MRKVLARQSATTVRRKGGGRKDTLSLQINGSRVPSGSYLSQIVQTCLEFIADGHPVAVMAADDEIGTQEAADLLKVSRPYLVKLLDAAPNGANYVRRAGESIAETHTLRLLNLRRASRAIAGAEPGPEGNVTKLLVAEAGQRITELGMELAGSAPVVGQAPKLLRSYLGNRAMTIAGGTSEITRNTIAERILGLPRDPLLK